MKAITRFEALDGSVHKTEDAAWERDGLVAECNAFRVSIRLRTAPDTCEFSNGSGYVQHPPGTKDRISAWLKKKRANRDTYGPVGKIMRVMWCMDDQDRQWGQGYFVEHPDAAQQIEVGS